MTDLKQLLTKLHKNLDVLQQRETRYGDDMPVDLLNQITNHQQAIGAVE